MLTDVQIINLGLSKGAASRVNRIDPARTPLETYMAQNYPQWKRSELAKRRWVFATVEDYPLTLLAEDGPGSKKYKFTLPIDCLRPIRGKRTEWVQRGRNIYSAYETLSIDYIRNVPESEFDPLFNDVLAARIWWESAEYVTQSNTKKADAKEDYVYALREAAKANAFVIGPEDLDEEDDEMTWLEAHHYG